MDPNEKRYRVPVETLDLELICAGSSVLEMNDFLALSRRMQEEGRHVIVELAGLMAPKVVSWSRDEPFSLHVLLSRFDYPDLYKILMQYVSAVIGVADPLEPRSSDGERSAPEMELGLASLSS